MCTQFYIWWLQMQGSLIWIWYKVKNCRDQIFWQIYQKIRFSWVLNSEHLCLINHLRLFWLHAASTASVKKCQNSKSFLLAGTLKLISHVTIEVIRQLLWVDNSGHLTYYLHFVPHPSIEFLLKSVGKKKHKVSIHL